MLYGEMTAAWAGSVVSVFRSFLGAAHVRFQQLLTAQHLLKRKHDRSKEFKIQVGGGRFYDLSSNVAANVRWSGIPVKWENHKHLSGSLEFTLPNTPSHTQRYKRKIRMFSLFYGLWKYMLSKVEFHVLILGIDKAGKTTLLEKLKSQYSNMEGLPPDKIVPTVGLNIGRVEVSNTKLIFWDLGGQPGLRSIWEKYYEEAHAVIYVIDAACPSRFEDSKSALEKVLRHEDLQGAPLLILANKQDLEDAVSVDELSQYLDLKKLDERVYTFQAVSAIDGLGIKESVNWLVDSMERSKRTDMLRVRAASTLEIKAVFLPPAANHDAGDDGVPPSYIDNQSRRHLPADILRSDRRWPHRAHLRWCRSRILSLMRCQRVDLRGRSRRLAAPSRASVHVAAGGMVAVGAADGESGGVAVLPANGSERKQRI
ncbi:GTP-binding protein 1 [Striga hermonthica]|uniref:GTP-binding protein 1 n=1 Tax=Striga hermonthica TaxID=68872 RepID=A0A9N7NJ85_STRHE|nr:GTP-binding protein 1 [Striga hermonthica]